MAATTNMPALTISQRGALQSVVRDYATACVHLAIVEADKSVSRERVAALRADAVDAWRAFTDWTLDVKWVDPSL